MLNHARLLNAALLAAGVLAASGCAALPGDDRLGSLLARHPQLEPAETPAGRMASAGQLVQAGRLAEARKIYEKLIAEHPDNPAAYHGLARVADLQRRHREAAALYGEAVRLRPRDPQLFNDLGYSLYLDGQLAKAESALLKATTMAPSNARFRNNLGLVYGQQRRYEQALEQFRLAGSEADAQYNLAFVLASQDEPQRAEQCFQLALAADPTHTKARSALDAFHRYERDPEGVFDHSAMVSSGVRWVPYVEGGSPGQQFVPTGAIAAAPAAGGSRSSEANSIQQRAHSMLVERAAQGGQAAGGPLPR